ncbi:uncharacterized protein LOC125248692 [Megalobrama amblycephala]|uniref:uncharacterized protein LOC125248692 n=1 Tax=Megalobrama amblycephala TaxID=75352 RepID=UPI0020143C4B|nr:uncharacterized protein LOC125248692 [Megalobrama amblycephala]
MASAALRVFIFCLLQLCIQCDEMPVNTEVLAEMIQYFDNKLQPTWYDQRGRIGYSQYAVLIRVPYQQCTGQFSLDSVFTNEVRNAFNDFKTNSRQRFYEVTRGSVRLTAAKPSRPLGSEENDHAEFILIYHRDYTNRSPLEKILSMNNDDKCVVLYTYYSPCIEKCINGAYDNILDGLSFWQESQTTGIKAFVFQEIWPNDSTGVPEDQQQQFTKINNLVPLYRCVYDDDNEMECYKCGDAGSETLHAYCVS